MLKTLKSYTCRASDISRGHGPAKFRCFREIPQNSQKNTKYREIRQKKSIEIGCFLLIVSWQSFPPKFPVKSADFSKNLPWKSFEIWLFSAKILRNRPIFLRILTFLPRKSHEIGRFLSEFWLFSRENPAKSADFSANLPLKIPRNFAFFFPRNIRSPVHWQSNCQNTGYCTFTGRYLEWRWRELAVEIQI